MKHYTADHHFFHKQIIRYCDRPFKTEPEMRREIVARYNSTVKADDEVYFIGDVAMLGASQWEHLKGVISSMNGIKHLIFGNHDEFKWQRYLDIGFTSVHSSLILEDSGHKLVLAHDPSVYCCIRDMILICGHVHTLFKSLPEKNVVNAGIDQWGFRPINIHDILEALK